MATTQDMLTEAQAALHALLTGTQAVEVRDSNGEMVRYTPSSVSRLRVYIQDLQAQIAGTQQSGRAPMRPIFC